MNVIVEAIRSLVPLAQNDSTKVAIMEHTNSLGRQTADAVYQMKDCCCTTNRNIDSVKAEAYKNTCDITTAIHAEGEATRALNVLARVKSVLAQ